MQSSEKKPIFAIKNRFMQNKVLLLYTGGTIGMGRSPQTGALEPLDFNNLVANMPEMEQIEAGIDVYQFDKPIDSSDMRPDAWAKLVRIIDSRYEQYDGFVILHGTDTMAYTASALSFMLENLTKPVILTGSQLPIGQLRTDGRKIWSRALNSPPHEMPTEAPWFPKFASISVGNCCAATVPRSKTPTDSTPSTRSTIHIFATRALISHSIPTTSSNPT